MLLLILFAAAGILVLVKTTGDAVSNGSSEDTKSNTASPAGFSSLNSLPDISPQDDSTNFDKEYDEYFLNASQSYGIPYALLKAHAIRESSLDHTAYRQEPNGKASYGLLQILWWSNSNRFKNYGYNDDTIGDGSLLYDPQVNSNISAQIMRENWNSTKNLRDMINMYNTGRKESVRVAPGNYVNDVLKYYGQICNQTIA